MKKITILMTAIMITFSVCSAMAQESPVVNFNIRAGISYPDAPEQVGLDTELGLDVWVNPFFACGIMTGFGWITKEYGKGDSVPVRDVSLDKNEDMNIYSLPLLATLKIGLGNLKEMYGVMPYIAGGAGYSWSFHRSSWYDDTFHGFTWQITGGVSFDLGEAANGMEIIVEAGYRGTNIENEDDLELDMSGFIAHLGVSFPLSGGSDF